MGKRTFRVARPEDAEALLAIYAPYVEETAITFEYEVPSVEAFRARIAHTLATYPYIVAVEEQEANAGTGRVDGASASCLDRAEANAGTAHVDGTPVSSAPASGAGEVTEAHRTSETSLAMPMSAVCTNARPTTGAWRPRSTSTGVHGSTGSGGSCTSVWRRSSAR